MDRPLDGQDAQSPQSLVDTRPATDLAFLELLRGKEHVLHHLATLDLEQRSLCNSSVDGVRSLGDIRKRIERSILCEVLHHCFYLANVSGRIPISWKPRRGRVLWRQRSA